MLVRDWLKCNPQVIRALCQNVAHKATGVRLKKRVVLIYLMNKTVMSL